MRQAAVSVMVLGIALLMAFVALDVLLGWGVL